MRGLHACTESEWAVALFHGISRVQLRCLSVGRVAFHVAQVPDAEKLRLKPDLSPISEVLNVL